MDIFGDWELALLNLDGLVFLGFEGLMFTVTYSCYKLYKQLSKEADVFEGLPLYTVGPELFSYVDKLPNKCLPYVGIRGLSKMSTDAHLQTSKFPSVGLIHEASEIVHKSISMLGLWTNAKDKISSVVRSCKFGICAPDSFTSKIDPSLFVEVRDPLKAENLLDNLPIIKDDFKPDPYFFKNILSGISGGYIIGHQYKEAALPEGVELFGVGKIFMTNGKPQLCFGPPDLIENKYILTTLTKPQIVNIMRKDAQVVKFMYYTFLFTGIAITAWLVYKYFIYIRETNRRFSALTRVIGVVTRKNVYIPNPSKSAPSNACSVCLASQTNTLELPCEHMICLGCYRDLTSPKKCPTCMTLIPYILN